MNGDKDNKPTAIVVLGDWVLDEYLFLRPHQSDISSYTSSRHYKVSEGPESSERRLCGAAHIAHHLVQLVENLNGEDCRKPHIFGLGNWASAHQEQMERLVSEGAVSITTRGSRGVRCDSKVSLCQIPPNQTLKVIRRYEVTREKPKQISRDDLVIEDAKETGGLTPDAAISKFLDRVHPYKIIAVIVFDLNKGAVTPKTIRSLYEAPNFEHAKWIVRSKQPDPEWFKDLAHGQPDLLAIGPEVLAFKNPTGQWLSFQKEKRNAAPRISRQTNELFEAFYASELPTQHALNLTGLKPKLLLLITAHREIIGIHDNPLAYFARQTFLEKNDFLMIGWSSRLIASLAFYASVHNIERLTSGDVDRGVELASRNKLLPEDSLPAPRSAASPSLFPWEIERERWKSALDPKKLGIVSIDSKDKPGVEGRLELWRSMTDVPGYVCCIDPKREILVNIARHLHHFRSHQNQGRSTSIWLRSDPGAGKTALIQRLSDLFDFGFIETSMNNLVRTEEIIDFFDAVSTVQASEKRPVLVFVDEINATIENQAVYRSFLSILDSLRYERRGRVFELQPCVWLFAGTTVDVVEHPAESKVRDFDDRITYSDSIDLVSLAEKVGSKVKNRLFSEAKLERVYLAALAIRARFPAVRYVSRALLQDLFDEGADGNIDNKRSDSRALAKKVAFLRNIDGNTLRRSDWIASVENMTPLSSKEGDDPLIELID